MYFPYFTTDGVPRSFPKRSLPSAGMSLKLPVLWAYLMPAHLLALYRRRAPPRPFVGVPPPLPELSFFSTFLNLHLKTYFPMYICFFGMRFKIYDCFGSKFNFEYIFVSFWIYFRPSPSPVCVVPKAGAAPPLHLGGHPPPPVTMLFLPISKIIPSFFWISF